MVNPIEPDQPQGGCRFCTDPDFAFRHTMEDDALLRIAEIATEITTTGMVGDVRRRLVEALQFFRDLDTAEAQTKRVIVSLTEIAEDLGDVDPVEHTL